MGLYTSFNTHDYYDDDPVIKKPDVKPTESPSKRTEYSKPHQVAETPTLKRSLYAETKEIASTISEYDHIDFRSLYRIGQMVRVENNVTGQVRTNKGRIVEIVAKDLMYVGMEDSHKDVHDNWMVDFVTNKDNVTLI